MSMDNVELGLDLVDQGGASAPTPPSDGVAGAGPLNLGLSLITQQSTGQTAATSQPLETPDVSKRMPATGEGVVNKGAPGTDDHSRPKTGLS